MSNMLGVFERSFNLMDLALSAVNKPTHLTFVETDKETGRLVESSLSQWAGGIDESTEGHIWGPRKAEDLRTHGDLHGITTTPVLTKPNYCEYKGGVKNERTIVACSAWENDRIDLLLALLAEYSTRYETRLHHVGFKFASDTERQIQMQKALNEVAVARKLPAGDHIRHYIRHEDERTPNGVYWTEFQEWPTHLVRNGIHLDFATMDPVGLLQHLEKYTGLNTTIWEPEKNSPSGMICGIEKNSKNEFEFAIMARPSWSDISTWAG